MLCAGALCESRSSGGTLGVQVLPCTFHIVLRSVVLKLSYELIKIIKFNKIPIDLRILSIWELQCLRALALLSSDLFLISLA